MAKTAAAYTTKTDSIAAGRHLAEQVKAEMDGSQPDALIVFASSQFDYEPLLESLEEGCHPKVMVGASSAGEFAKGEMSEGAASALAISAPEIQFASSLGVGVKEDCTKAAGELVAKFEGMHQYDHSHRAALVLADSLAGQTDMLIEQLTVLTGARYQFAGGGAGDDVQFAHTHVFCGTKAYEDAAVALEVLSHKPIGIGVSHGWVPASQPYRVTEAEGRRLVSLNGRPTVEIFEQHAAKNDQPLDASDPLPFFLHNILGIDTEDGYRLRVPLSIDDDGAVMCASEVPPGTSLRIMRTTSESAIEAAATAVRSALGMLGGEEPCGALFFDCPASRSRLGDDFKLELSTIEDALGDANMVGCNTYGQIARGNGQFNAFHNCTPVVFVLPA